jgi:precorrin-8X/cobalt-precorrin-8 methylmutase
MFDTFLMVDWSAASVPRRGRDSIWICSKSPRGERLDNPPTRHAARALLAALLGEAFERGERVLSGFDFPFGYPTGFAARLHLRGPPWRALWDEIARLVEDAPDNANNRFAVAATLNERVSKGPFPFWGCPAGKANPCLAPRHHHGHDAEGLAERRLIDASMRGAQPCWKLVGAGSVGGQALTGIPVVRALRDDPRWREEAAVWPFETGLAAPGRARVVFAEIYPSLWKIAPEPAEPKDKAQVRAVARLLAELDRAGALAPLFSGDPSLSPEERRRAENEEAWTLGVTRRRARGEREEREGKGECAYLRDPAEITRRSFALIAAQTPLDRFPRPLRPLALRLAHAAGDTSILADLAWSQGALAAGKKALAAGAPILVDSQMVAAGIVRRRLPAANPVVCTLKEPQTESLAKALGTTRSAAAVELWREHLAGAVVAIGTAPTALFHLLEMIASGAPKPALVLGFPVGFVGAAEAKAALAEFGRGLAFVTLKGRRGGSALAAAAVNALAEAPS